jgi:hypothetical protein
MFSLKGCLAPPNNLKLLARGNRASTKVPAVYRLSDSLLHLPGSKSHWRRALGEDWFTLIGAVGSSNQPIDSGRPLA